MKYALTIIGWTLVALAIAFVINLAVSGVIVWLLVLLLNALGVYAIGSFAVVFSWKLVIIFSLLAAILRPAKITIKGE